MIKRARVIFLLIFFCLMTSLNLVYYSNLGRAPESEINNLINSMVSESNQLGAALDYITEHKEEIYLYSVSQEGIIVNVNDFSARLLPPIPRESIMKAKEYSYNNSHFLIGYVKNMDGSGVLLLYDFVNFEGYLSFYILELLLILLLLFTYIIIYFSEKSKKADETRSTFESRTKIQGALSHELKTPVAAIRGYNDLIDSSLKIEDIKYYSKKIEKNLERLINSIEQILMYSKAVGGERDKVAWMELSEIVERQVKIYKEIAGERVVNLDLGFSKVVQNPEIVEILISNILSNFVKHASAGAVLTIRSTLKEGRLSVDFSQVEVEGSKILKVKGSGVGLEIIDYLSQRYKIDLRRDDNFSYFLIF